MTSASTEIDQLIGEHQALMRHYGKTQSRCSEAMVVQAAELAGLRTQVMRLRAAVISRDTALSWEREDRAALRALIPGLQPRLALARRVDHLVGRIQQLLRERLHWQWRRMTDHASHAMTPVCQPTEPVETIVMPNGDRDRMEDDTGFETSLAAADLVICQTGCLSHDAYWRVQDHCKRTGKACVVVAQPDAVRIVRIHPARPGNPTPGTIDEPLSR